MSGRECSPFFHSVRGVAWACQLLHDITEHWELRNADALHRTDPRNLDLARLDLNNAVRIYRNEELCKRIEDAADDILIMEPPPFFH